MDLRNVHYDAFISYRHCKLDMEVAKGIHRRLEAYKLPKEAVSKVTNGKTKIERVFRDQDELPLADNLSDPINMALMNSDFLLVICTPRLPESKWCRKEINTFIKCHDRDHVLLVLAEGEPEESFPRELTAIEKTVIGEDGIPHTEYVEIEPLAADVRGKSEHERAKQMDAATLRLAASIFGVNYDDLRMRHKEQQTRKRMKLFGGIAAFMCIFSAVCLGLLLTINSQKKTISSQYTEIQEKYESSMVMASKELNSLGHHMDALYALVNAVDSEEYSDKTAEALSETLNVFNPTTSRIPLCEYYVPGEVIHFELNADCSRIAIVSADGTISIFNTETAELTDSVKFAEKFSGGDDFMHFVGTDSLFYAFDKQLYLHNCITHEDKAILGSSPFLIGTAGLDYAFGYAAGVLYAYDSEGTELFNFDIGQMAGSTPLFSYDCNYSFSSDMTKLTALLDIGILGQKALTVIDIPSRTLQLLVIVNAESNSYALTEDDKVYFYAGTDYMSNSYESEFIVLDAYTADELWNCQISDGFYRKILLKENTILLSGNFTSLAIDTTTHTVSTTVQFPKQALKSSLLTGSSMLTIYVDGMFDSILLNGEAVYYDYSPRYYYTLPNMKIIDASMGANQIFLAPASSNYVVRYYPRPSGTLLEDTEYDLESRCDLALISENPSDKVVMKSNDGIYTFRQSFDGSVRIEDSEENIVSTLYNIKEDIVGVRYLDEIGKYCINCTYSSYLLGDKLQIIATLFPVVDFKDGNFICHIDYENYSVPYINKKDLLSMAKEELGSYVPSDEIKARYGIR